MQGGAVTSLDWVKTDQIKLTQWSTGKRQFAWQKRCPASLVLLSLRIKEKPLRGIFWRTHGCGRSNANLSLVFTVCILFIAVAILT